MAWLEWLFIFCVILLIYKVSSVIFVKVRKHLQLKNLRSQAYKPAKLIFQNLYPSTVSNHTINPFQISQQERERLDLHDYSMVYGEINFEGLATLLAYAKPKPHETFYDLGAGSGKAVFAAALLYPWQGVYGIEILPGLHELCLKQRKQFEKLVAEVSYYEIWKFTINFHCDDLFQQDLSKANIVFINATGFFGDTLQQLIDKLQQLPVDARILIASKQLPEQQFQLIKSEIITMSWGPCQSFVYKKLFK